PRFTARTAVDLARHPRWLAQFAAGPQITYENIGDGTRGRVVSMARYVHEELANPAADLETLKRIRRLWPGPLVVKALMTGEDAERAVAAGADGIVVSNHGGRQLDGEAASLRALPEVVAAVGDRAEVFLEGGVRRGTDVVKALALGARACFMGRPYLYGLAAGGQDGVSRVLTVLREEIDVALALLGRTRIDELDRS